VAKHESRSRLWRTFRIGWRVKNKKSGSHIQLEREGWPNFTWAFHDNEEIGPVMLKRIAKRTGLKPEDL
jgi:predicted RNA binding protein YcfA (HicA-like mRNA interferase family)